jgi:hypothetical protein
MSIPTERPEIDDEPIPEMGRGHVGFTASPESVAQLGGVDGSSRFERWHLA